MRQTLFDGDPRDARSRRDLMLSCRRLVELGRRTGEAESARQCLMETIGKLERLADGGPADTALRRDLARAHEQLGGLLVVLNDFDSARGSYERALGIYLPLAADTGDIEAQSDLADAYQALGYCEQLAMRFDQALPWYDRALELFARLDAAGQLADRPVLNETLERVRHESDETRAAAGAVESLDWALEQPAALVPRLLYMRSVVLARRGQHPLAAQAAAKLAELLPDDPSAQYDAACGFALAAAVGHDDETPAADENAIRDGYAARAMELLRHAVEAGYADLVHMRHDSDLRALAERDDFRAFLRELEGEHD
jgi:tetratricopeptide (TPR) repeat protein